MGQVVVSGMLPSVRILHESYVCLQPRRRDPAVQDDGFAGMIAPDENRQYVSEATVLQLPYFAPLVIASCSDCQPSTTFPSVNTDAILKRLQWNVSRFEFSPIARERR